MEARARAALSTFPLFSYLDADLQLVARRRAHDGGGARQQGEREEELQGEGEECVCVADATLSLSLLLLLSHAAAAAAAATLATRATPAGRAGGGRNERVCVSQCRTLVPSLLHSLAPLALRHLLPW